MKCVSVESKGKVLVKNIDIPTPKAHEVLIQVKASGICGTDIHIMDGDYVANYPLIIGHEFSGKVVEIGSQCQRITVGERVAVEPNIPCNNCEFCLNDKHHFCSNMVIPGALIPGGMAEYVCVPEIGVFSINAIPYDAAAFMEPLSCVIHGASRLAIKSGSRLLVMGAGPNGVLQGKIASLQGITEIDYLEKNPFRANEVKKYNWGTIFSTTEEVPKCHYDAVIEATGVNALASFASQVVKPTGKILLFGVPSMGSKIELDAFSLFKNELSYIGTYTSKKDSLQALSLLEKSTLNVEELISHRITLEQVPEFLLKLKSLEENIKKVMVIND